MSRLIRGDTKKHGTERVVAVAIENNKTSQLAAKWAVENLITKEQCLLLIHVKQRPSSVPPGMDINQEEFIAHDNEAKELFDSFRVLCNRKSVQFRKVMLEDMDISKALIESVSSYSIELLVLGASTRSSILKIFRATDVPTLVSKGAPQFCTVYIISKGKILTVRNASIPLKTIEQSQQDIASTSNFSPRSPKLEPRPFASYGSRHSQDKEDMIMGRSYRSAMQESDISFVGSSKPRISNASSYYDESRSSFGSYYGATSTQLSDYTSFNSQPASSRKLSTCDSKDKMEAEMRKLKLELKQTMEMYGTACKEAVSAKQQTMELQHWKLEEQKKLEEARMAEEVAMMKTCHAEKKKGTESFGLGSARYRRYTIKEIEEATNCFSESLKIGEGGYGPVYKCELDQTQVAVKVLKSDAAEAREQFQQEVEVLSCIRHPNMVLLLGACPEYGCLVYEYMARGSLEDCLFRKGNSLTLPWQLRFQIAAEIATGLLFLHQTKPEPLVHRDLKPGNILLDRNYVSKISDVGLARLIPPSDSVTQYRMTSTAGTFCYIDPEYQQTGMLGIKSDIYSLGIILLQIVTARPPMGLTHQVESSIKKGTFAEMLDPSVGDWPIEQTVHFAKLALQCSEMRKKDRPDLGKVVLPELNKLRAFAEENMPMIMRFGGGAGFGVGSEYTSQVQGSEANSQTLSGYDINSGTSSIGGA